MTARMSRTARTVRASCRRRESGLTLVELLIALALLGFVMLGIAPLFIASVKSNYSANEYTSIHMLARDRLEQLMNRPFLDAELAPGIYANDQPAVLPDPLTEIPPAVNGVANPLQITYQVLEYQVAALDTGTTPVNAPFAPTRVTAAGQIFQYKRIDVTVTSGTGPLGIGARVARVSGLISNPAPTLPANFSVADGCAIGGAAPCP
jgi:prepilin-type N-terminal cleavage/methylation domain-containing protein